MNRVLAFLREHGIDCRPTQAGMIICWDVWSYREDDGTVSGRSEWYEIYPTIRAAKNFLNY